jgi:hypothetical protein
MATITAQFLIGHAHTNHGGIIPTHQMFLYENDRPRLVLSEIGDFGRPLAVWVPTVEHMLDDALLMIAVHVIGEFKMKDISKKKGKGSKLFEVYDDMDKKIHTTLLKELPSLPGFPKVAVTILAGSELLKHLPAIKRYSMDVEVCATCYARSKSAWTQTTSITDFIDFLAPKLS